MNEKLFIKNNLLNEFEGRLNVIVADVDWETFETVSQIKKDFNFINLSSEFAVSFILEYEKVDILIFNDGYISDWTIFNRKDRNSFSTLFD